MAREFICLTEESSSGVDYDVAAAGTPAAWTGGTVRAASAGMSAASGVVTVSNGGHYRATYAGSVRGEDSAVIQVTLFKGSAAVSGTETTGTAASTAVVQAVAGGTILHLDDDDTVTLKFDSDTNGDDVAVYHMCLILEQVGGL